MPVNKSKADCSGCTACANICPKDCITMQPDVLGFKYPVVEKECCIDCGLCERICPFHETYRTTGFDSPIAYVGKNNDPKEVAKSQSGAASATLSDWIIEQGGVVYGVGYEGHFRATHKRATTKEERDEFRGSKYVQSELGDIFKQVKKDLQDGYTVMFTGTPCQIAGLAAFIPDKLKERLYLVDLVCHGVPGPKMWEDYLAYLEEKEGDTIVGVNFRDKGLKGWRSHVESFRYAHKPYTYTYIFYSHVNLRYSCGNCYFTNLRRVGDITICDAWGIENTHSAELGADNKGCSLFLVNTEKGRQWFEAIKGHLVYRSEEIEGALRQPQLCRPSKLHPKRDQFEQDYANNDFGFIIEKYGRDTLWNRMKSLIISLLPCKIKSYIKRLVKAL